MNSIVLEALQPMVWRIKLPHWANYTD